MPLYLMMRVAGERVALPAAAIEAVVELETLTPVPQAAAHVAGLAALRSRLVTVIDVRVALGLPPTPPRLPMEAVIVTLDGHCYGLVVDAVEDVGEAPPPRPAQAPLGSGWAMATQGLVEVEGDLLLLLDPEALIAPSSAVAA